MKKVSEWLSEHLSSHGIFDADGIAQTFIKETGEQPCWPTHSAAQAEADIVGRGKGGGMKKKVAKSKKMVYGYEVAEALSDKYTDFQPWQTGLGFRFYSAIEALQKVGK